jgi:hypothetical protein
MTGSFEHVLDPVNGSDCPCNGECWTRKLEKIRIRNVTMEMIIN